MVLIAEPGFCSLHQSSTAQDTSADSHLGQSRQSNQPQSQTLWCDARTGSVNLMRNPSAEAYV